MNVIQITKYLCGQLIHSLDKCVLITCTADSVLVPNNTAVNTTNKIMAVTAFVFCIKEVKENKIPQSEVQGV